MMGYIHHTLKDVMQSDLINNKDFISYVQAYLRGNLWISTGPLGGDGEGAKIQVRFSRFDGTLRVFMDEDNYWFSQRCVGEECLKYLVDKWADFKENLDQGLQFAIKRTNIDNQREVEHQLELHEAIKNFQV